MFHAVCCDIVGNQPCRSAGQRRKITRLRPAGREAATGPVRSEKRGWTGEGRMQTIKIISFATLAAVVYGILHDQVTAHVCVEYFTIAHPPVFPTDSPFLLAIGWGIIATWWVGLPLGGLLAAAARIGSAPKLGLGELRRSILLLMVVSGCIAIASGAIGATLVAMQVTDLAGGWGDVIPKEKWVAFSFSMWAHAASYMAGALGGAFVIASTIRRRLSIRRT